MECPENVPSVSHSGCSVDDNQGHVSPHHATLTVNRAVNRSWPNLKSSLQVN
jgi:hypothetical protein